MTYTKTVIDRNSAKCLKCNTEVESTFRHDFTACPCGNVRVDGGREYSRVVVKSSDEYEDTSISHEEPREKYEWEQ